MATLSRLEMPDKLLHAIERRAALNNLSTEEQVVRDLTAIAGAAPNEEARLLEDVRRERDALAARGVFITDDDLMPRRRGAGSDRR